MHPINHISLIQVCRANVHIPSSSRVSLEREEAWHDDFICE
jgi:hypothetical protein